MVIAIALPCQLIAGNSAGIKRILSINTVAGSDTIKTVDGMLKEYKAGKRDSSLLRDLALGLIKQKQRVLADEVSQVHIKLLKSPLAKSNLEFMSNFNHSITSKGFDCMLKNKDKINEMMGGGWVDFVLSRSIEDTYIQTELNAGKKVDWEQLSKQLFSRYGEDGNDLVIRAKLNYAFHHDDWKTFSLMIGPWFKKMTNQQKFISTSACNDFSWSIFERSNNKKLLGSGLALMDYALKTDSSAELIDTYANLLYKLGRREEAMIWEKKAVDRQPDNEVISETYEKMKNSLRMLSGKHTVSFSKKRSLKDVLKDAKSRNKYIMLDFMATWCGPCKKMDKYVYTDDAVGKALNNVVISVKIQVDKTNFDSKYVKSWHADAARLTEEYAVTGLPTLIFLTPDGKVAKKVVGGVDAATLIAHVNDVLKADK